MSAALPGTDLGLLQGAPTWCDPLTTARTKRVPVPSPREIRWGGSIRWARSFESDRPTPLRRNNRGAVTSARFTSLRFMHSATLLVKDEAGLLHQIL